MGVIPKRLRMKKYFKYAVLVFGIEAQAKGEKIPRLLRNAVPSDLLPWWPKELKRRRRRFGKRPFPTSLKDLEAKGQAVEIETTGPHIHQDLSKRDKHPYKSH